MNRMDDADLQALASLTMHAPDARRAEAVSARCQALLARGETRRARQNARRQAVARRLELITLGALGLAYLAAALLVASKDVGFIYSHFWE